MSVYQVNKLLYLTDNDLAFRKRMMEEPEAVLNEFKLTEEEREALTTTTSRACSCSTSSSSPKKNARRLLQEQWVSSIRWAYTLFY